MEPGKTNRDSTHLIHSIKEVCDHAEKSNAVGGGPAVERDMDLARSIVEKLLYLGFAEVEFGDDPRVYSIA